MAEKPSTKSTNEDNEVSILLNKLSDNNVEFLRMQFTDIMGVNKNIEVPASQFEKAISGEIMFDGSSIEGFARIEESDMLLTPDLSTLVIFPDNLEDAYHGKVAGLTCDVTNPAGEAFMGDPRQILKHQLREMEALGFSQMNTGTEAEYFLFDLDADGRPSTLGRDTAGYFDRSSDHSERVRREMVTTLVKMGVEIEAAHHEVAAAQHEIAFRYGDALRTADHLMMLKLVVRRIATLNDLHATFMPKPLAGVSGSGMHVHISLAKDNENAFFDKKAEYQLSTTALHFIAGVLEHAPGITLITNPLINSYKRLVPGYEAPTQIAWSAANRSAMIRIPAKRGMSTRMEYRVPDAACNPYLAFAVILAAGLDGIKRELEPPPPIQRNIYEMSLRDRRRHKIKELPVNLREAIAAAERDKLVKATLGEQIYEHFINAKKQELEAYRTVVHHWELQRYLADY